MKSEEARMKPEKNECSHHGVADNTRREYSNETIRLLHERASVRSFENKPIPPDVLQLILESGVHAATGGNLQPYSIIEITELPPKKKLAEMCEQEFIGEAPVDLLFCIDWRRLERWAALEAAPFSGNSSFRHFWISFQDTIVAAQNICTAADALGLGSVYIGTVLECFRELREMFQLPRGVFPVVLLCLGYPKHYPSPRKKLDVDIIVHSEKYREMEDHELLDAYNKKYPWTNEIRPERMERIERACRTVHGDNFAAKCLEKIRKSGYITPVQNYFGLHYCADEMPIGNEEYLKIMEEFGFDWFKKYQPDVKENNDG
jgi:nitroreductase